MRAVPRALTLAFAAALAALTAACGSPPPKGGAQAPPRRAPVLDTPQAEADAGREGAKEVEAAIGVVTDPALRAYVQEVGARLARHAPGFRYDYAFEIADQAAPNAFALPGGRIYISRGALALTASEDELACVLGHEIAHVASRHAAAQQQVGGGALMQTLQFQSLAAYSRDLETTADRLGQGLAAVSGYDPAGMATFLASLDRLDRFQRGVSRRAGFLDSHPGTPGRAHEMAARAGTMHWQRPPGRSDDPAVHLRRIAGVVLGDDPAQGVFDGPRFLHADLAFTLRFPDGFETVNTPAAVAAIAPDRRMQILLELAGPGQDLAAAAAAFETRSGRGLAIAEAGPLRVAGREAFRITGAAGGAPFMSTFLSHRGAVYQLSCVGGPRSRLEALCNVTTRSFRPMTPELLAHVRVLRLALAEARTGESLAELGGRSANAWGAAETAAWNGLSVGSALRAGALVKVAHSEPYLPGGRSAPR